MIIKAKQNTAPIRTITKRSFMQRFEQAERIAIRKSDDDIVIDIHEDLKLASYVDLDDLGVIGAVGYLVAIDLVSEDSQTQLFADGTEREAI